MASLRQRTTRTIQPRRGIGQQPKTRTTAGPAGAMIRPTNNAMREFMRVPFPRLISGGTGGPGVTEAAVLTATAGDGTVALEWVMPAILAGKQGEVSPGREATAVEIYRGEDTGEETLLTVVGPGETTYDDDSAANGTEYFYTVAVRNSAGLSPMSNEESATPSA